MITPLIDGHGRIHVPAITPDPGPASNSSTRTQAPAESAAGTWAQTLDITVGAFLIQTGRHKILVDLGMGPTHNDTFHGGALLQNLHRQGVTADQIDHVVLTHLHWDHIGWACTPTSTTTSHPNGTSSGNRPLTATFPNARYWCGRADWEHFVQAGRAPQQTLTALADVFGASEDLDIPGLNAVPASGHTPGSFVYTTNDPDLQRQVWFVGDLVHSPDELDQEHQPILGDVCPCRARKVRHQILGAAARAEAVVVPAHFDGLSGVQLTNDQFPFASTPFRWDRP